MLSKYLLVTIVGLIHNNGACFDVNVWRKLDPCERHFKHRYSNQIRNRSFPHFLHEGATQLDRKNNLKIRNHAQKNLALRVLGDESYNAKDKLIDQINNKIKTIPAYNPKIQKIVLQIRTEMASKKTTISTLNFISDCLDTFMKTNRFKIRPALYRYMARELSKFGPINESLFDDVRDKNFEELTAIMDYYDAKYPTSVTTIALDWLLRIKIAVVVKKGDIFTILRETYKKTIDGRGLKLVNLQRTRFRTKFLRVKIQKVELGRNEQEILQRARGK